MMARLRYLLSVLNRRHLFGAELSNIYHKLHKIIQDTQTCKCSDRCKFRFLIARGYVLSLKRDVEILKEKFTILHIKPCFQIVSNEIQRLKGVLQVRFGSELIHNIVQQYK